MVQAIFLLCNDLEDRRLLRQFGCARDFTIGAVETIRFLEWLQNECNATVIFITSSLFFFIHTFNPRTGRTDERDGRGRDGEVNDKVPQQAGRPAEPRRAAHCMTSSLFYIVFFQDEINAANLFLPPAGVGARVAGGDAPTFVG